MGVPSSQAKRTNIKAANLLLSLAFPNDNEIVICKKKKNKRRRNNNGMFECKTCNREFPSFQALGGHCTSHLKPKVSFNGIDLKLGEKYKQPMRHVCGSCGKEFLTGQALGGHMRLHRTSPVIPELGGSQREDEYDLNVIPTLTNGTLGFYTDADVVSDEGSPRVRLLKLFE
jgi:C2H2-type zinc finger